MSLLLLRETEAKEMKDATKALLVILSSSLYLACQGLAVHDHDDAVSNLRQLLELQANDNSELQSWKFK